MTLASPENSLETQMLRSHPTPMNQTLRMSHNLCFNKPSGGSDAHLKPDSYWPRWFSFSFLTPCWSVTNSYGLFHPPWFGWASRSYPVVLVLFIPDTHAATGAPLLSLSPLSLVLASPLKTNWIISPLWNLSNNSSFLMKFQLSDIYTLYLAYFQLYLEVKILVRQTSFSFPLFVTLSF